MKRLCLISAIFITSIRFVFSQELYPNTEPASNCPKGVLTVRSTSELYKELDQVRSAQGYMFMFGLSSKLMLTQMFNFSNHHGIKLPVDFIKNDGSVGLHTHGSKKGGKYPYAFENYSLSAKYRFISSDALHSHYRMAAYFSVAGGRGAHDEAEPNLMGDNSGIAGGIISTALLHKLALSVTGGFILPHAYEQSDSMIVMNYGSAINYSLSIGYLLYPRLYQDYNQTNINIYMEFLGKSYDAAKISMRGQTISTDGVASLGSGNYVEARPAIQLIIHSNTRLDFSVAFPFIGTSYVKTYPAYYINLQHYFYFK